MVQIEKKILMRAEPSEIRISKLYPQFTKPQWKSDNLKKNEYKCAKIVLIEVEITLLRVP